jgi:hypothetical protein
MHVAQRARPEYDQRASRDSLGATATAQLTDRGI